MQQIMFVSSWLHCGGGGGGGVAGRDNAGRFYGNGRTDEARGEVGGGSERGHIVSTRWADELAGTRHTPPLSASLTLAVSGSLFAPFCVPRRHTTHTPHAHPLSLCLSLSLSLSSLRSALPHQAWPPPHCPVRMEEGRKNRQGATRAEVSY